MFYYQYSCEYKSRSKNWRLLPYLYLCFNNGACHIADDTFVGSQSVVNQGISVCKSVVGSYSLVNKNIEVPGVYVGIPAKFIKQI